MNLLNTHKEVGMPTRADFVITMEKLAVERDEAVATLEVKADKLRDEFRDVGDRLAALDDLIGRYEVESTTIRKFVDDFQCIVG
jgi:hypothetical protein